MTAHVLGLQAETEHIQPFVPYRDLTSLASLIEVAFGSELVTTDSHIVQDLRQLAMLGPLLRGSGSAASPFAGYVWYEDGRLVGNVSLSPEKEDHTVWTVSNVAVLPEYRGNGIAGQLIDQAIRYARSRGARQLSLQVRPDNAGAVALYLHRGFRTLYTVHELLLHRHNWPVTPEVAPAAIRAPRPGDHRAIQSLLSALGSVGGQPPARRRTTRADWLWRTQLALRYALTAERTIEVVACTADGLAGYAFAQTNSLNGPHEAALYVAPQHRGRYELAMWEWLLDRLRSAVPHHVRTVVATSHPEALQAAWNLGFRTQRVLDQMALDLQPALGPSGLVD